MPLVELNSATFRVNERELWRDLSISIEEGEFLAILGPNGVGKTSLLQVLLGEVDLYSGEVRVVGSDPKIARHDIGYIPQQRAFDSNMPVRGRDLVHLGVDGHKFGLPFNRGDCVRQVNSAVDAVGATEFADAPIGQLSGGEQQRLRVAQALVSRPRVLLCDEPLLSLDISQQQIVSALMDEYRRATKAAVLFVTHDINPVLAYVDRVLYLVGGRAAIGTPQEILTSERLSELYGTAVDVLDIRGRVIVIAGEDGESVHAEHEHSFIHEGHHH
jgi:zinc/manganese transport system ATP-binding protein